MVILDSMVLHANAGCKPLELLLVAVRVTRAPLKMLEQTF